MSFERYTRPRIRITPRDIEEDVNIDELPQFEPINHPSPRRKRSEKKTIPPTADLVITPTSELTILNDGTNRVITIIEFAGNAFDIMQELKYQKERRIKKLQDK